MNIVLFTKEQHVLEHWKEKLNNLDLSRFEETFICSSFKQLGNAIADENHILLFHLSSGEDEEKICYQFI